MPMEEKDVCFGGSDALFAISWMWLEDVDAWDCASALDELAATGGMTGCSVDRQQW